MIKSKLKNIKVSHKKTLIIYYCLILILAALSIFNLSFYINIKPKVLYIENNDLNYHLSFWGSFLKIHPDYFEGWVELSKLEIKGGRRDEALSAYTKALKINPNSASTNAIENILGKN